MRKIIIILALLILTSCDPGVVNKYVVENRTNSELRIVSILNKGLRNINEIDSIRVTDIGTKKESIIIKYGEIGNAHDKKNDFLNRIDSLTVKVRNKNLRKNIFERKNWEYKVLKSRILSTDEVEYKLILTENDFE